MYGNSTEQALQYLMFFAHVLNKQPDEAFVQNLRENYTDENVDEVRQFWAAHKGKEDSQIAMELAAEWNVLFRGVGGDAGQKPPYAGVYLSADGIGVNVVSEIKAAYDRHGYKPNRNDRPDWLGNMLEFAVYIADDSAALEEYCDNFITVWVSRFANEAMVRADSGFYKDVLLALGEIPACIDSLLRNSDD